MVMFSMDKIYGFKLVSYALSYGRRNIWSIRGTLSMDENMLNKTRVKTSWSLCLEPMDREKNMVVHRNKYFEETMSFKRISTYPLAKY